MRLQGGQARFGQSIRLSKSRPISEVHLESNNEHAESTSNFAAWPNCVLAGGNCIGFDLMSRLGLKVNQVLMEFVWNSRDGSRLTIQKSRQGFTVQVTGEVHRSEGESNVSFEQFKRLKLHLDSTTDLNT